MSAPPPVFYYICLVPPPEKDRQFLGRTSALPTNILLDSFFPLLAGESQECPGRTSGPPPRICSPPSLVPRLVIFC